MANGYHAMHIGEKEAGIIYPVLPEHVRDEYTQDEFAKFIEELLIETGNIKGRQSVTILGRAHGFYMTSGCSAEYDENGEMIFHSRYPLVSVNEKGKNYVAELIKARFPDFDEDKYHDHLRKLKIESGKSIIEMGDEYKALPAEVADFLWRVITNQIDNQYIFLCCDYEDETSIIKVLEGYEWAYYSKKDIVAMSGAQLAVNWQYDLLRENENGLHEYLINYGNGRFAIIIDRIEDITKYPRTQEMLSKLLSNIVSCRITVIFLSENEPDWMFGMTEELRSLLCYSSYFFDARSLCRKKKHPEFLDDSDLRAYLEYEMKNYERPEYRIKEIDTGLPF